MSNNTVNDAKERKQISLTLTEYEVGVLKDVVNDAFLAESQKIAKYYSKIGALAFILTDLNKDAGIAKPSVPVTLGAIDAISKRITCG